MVFPFVLWVDVWCLESHPFLFSVASLWSLLCSLLLYKRLPSKVTLLSLILNVYFIGLQLYSEGKVYSSVSLLISNYCIAYRNNIVSRQNIRAYLGTRWGYFWSPCQCCGINWSPELRFGRVKAYWLYRHHWRQALAHNPIILNYATIINFYLCI